MPAKAPHLLPWVWRRVRVALFKNSIKQAKRPFKNFDPLIILNVNTLAAGTHLFSHTAKVRHYETIE